jgi:hypothetical protein
MLYRRHAFDLIRHAAQGETAQEATMYRLASEPSMNRL